MSVKPVSFPQLLESQTRLFQSRLITCQNQQSISQLRRTFLGRHSVVVQTFNAFSPADKQRFSPAFANWKMEVAKQLQTYQLPVVSSSFAFELPPLLAQTFPTVSLSNQFLRSAVWNPTSGNFHPLTNLINALHHFFARHQFQFLRVSELTTVQNNFSTLNIDPDHPAYDPAGCFFIDPKMVLRTHTTNFTSHILQTYYHQLANHNFFAYTIGNVYRNDTDDATHVPKFIQLDGCMWGKNLNLAKLKGFLTTMAQFLFGQQVTVRFRPNYFPFTEPSLEMDLKCLQCPGLTCSICKGTGWIEILGAGVIHKNVLQKCQIADHPVILAFGIGIERIAMVKYQIRDIRDLTQEVWIKDEKYAF